MFGAMGWGLRRYAWLVTLFILGIGLLIPLSQSRAEKVYEAEAYVGPVGPLTLPNLDPLPRMGETLFNNGAVAVEVRQELGLSGDAPVIPGRAELVAAQDNPIFTVLGRAPDPNAAAAVANAAAAAFVIQMNVFGGQPVSGQPPAVGSFAVTTMAQSPTKPVPDLMGGRVAILVGLVAGALAGIGAVGLLVVLRRPVIDSTTARETTDAPVFGRVSVPRRGRTDHRDVGGVGALCRRLLASGFDVILLAGPTARTGQRQAVARAMSSVLGRIRRTRVVSGRPDSVSAPGPSGDRKVTELEAKKRPLELVVVDDYSQAEFAGPADNRLTLLVVPEGISARSLREAAENYLDGGPSGLVLVRKARRRRHGGTAAGLRLPETTFAEEQGRRRSGNPTLALSDETNDEGSEPEAEPSASVARR